MSVSAEKGTCTCIDACVIWAGCCPVSGSDLSSEETCVRVCVCVGAWVRGQGGGAVRGFDDRRAAAADEHRRWPGGSTCVIGSVGECWVANGWPGRAGGITCRAAPTWSGRG